MSKSFNHYFIDNQSFKNENKMIISIQDEINILKPKKVTIKKKYNKKITKALLLIIFALLLFVCNPLKIFHQLDLNSDLTCNTNKFEHIYGIVNA